MKMSNIIVAFIIFSVATALFTQAYTALIENYDITPTDTQDGKTVMQKLNDIQIIAGIEDIITGIAKISNPTATLFDILGGLTAAGIGLLKVSLGVLTFPVEILGVITGFYYVPPAISTGMGIIFAIYVLFILIRNYTKENN